jgi:hypothetical protein
MPRCALLASVLWILAACEISPAEPGPPIGMTTVFAAQHSGMDLPRTDIIRDRHAWAQSWDEIHARTTPLPPLPEIDFQRHLLVLVAIGERPNGCYDVEIRSLHRGHGRLWVSAREWVPVPHCVCTQELVQPVHVVRVERTPGQAELGIRPSSLSCG